MLMLNPSNRTKTFVALRSPYFKNIRKSIYLSSSVDEEYDRIKKDNEMNFDKKSIKPVIIGNKSIEFTPFSMNDEELYNNQKNKQQLHDLNQYQQEVQYHKQYNDYNNEYLNIENINNTDKISGDDNTNSTKVHNVNNEKINNDNNYINNNKNNNNKDKKMYNNKEIDNNNSKIIDETNKNQKKLGLLNKSLHNEDIDINNNTFINNGNDKNNRSYIIKTNSNLNFEKLNNEEVISASIILKTNEFEDENKLIDEESFNSNNENFKNNDLLDNHINQTLENINKNNPKSFSKNNKNFSINNKMQNQSNLNTKIKNVIDNNENDQKRKIKRKEKHKDQKNKHQRIEIHNKRKDRNNDNPIIKKTHNKIHQKEKSLKRKKRDENEDDNYSIDSIENEYLKNVKKQKGITYSNYNHNQQCSDNNYQNYEYSSNNIYPVINPMNGISNFQPILFSNQPLQCINCKSTIPIINPIMPSLYLPINPQVILDNNIHTHHNKSSKNYKKKSKKIKDTNNHEVYNKDTPDSNINDNKEVIEATETINSSTKGKIYIL